MDGETEASRAMQSWKMFKLIDDSTIKMSWAKFAIIHPANTTSRSWIRDDEVWGLDEYKLACPI